MDKMFKIIILIVKMMLFVITLIEHVENDVALFDIVVIVVHFVVIYYECYQFFRRE